METVETNNEHYVFSDKIRELISKEDRLINNRMNWFLVIQGFLFTAFATVDQLSIFRYVLTVVGLVMPLSLAYTLWMREESIGYLTKRWKTYCESNSIDREDYPSVWAGFEKAIFGECKCMKQLRFLEDRKMIPKLFFLVWVTVLILLIVKVM